jgi:hypothetical protein
MGCGTLNAVDSSDADNWIGGLSLWMCLIRWFMDHNKTI